MNGKDLSAYSDDLNLADGNWHHIAVTYDATTGDRTIYIDGAKKATDKPEVIASDTETVTATDIRIGVDQNDQYFDGTIESTLIWNRSLSEAEIIKRQTIPSSGNESGLVALHRFNEGNGNQVDAEGTTDSDLTGTLVGGATWSSPTTESAWFSVNEILSSEEDGKLGLSKDQLNQKGVNYEQLTTGTLSIQVQSIDAGGHQSSSTTFDLQIPEPPAEDLRPERLQIDSVSLTEGDNLQHTGSHVVPLFLRDRNLDIQSSVIALKDYIVPQSKPSFTRFNVFLRDKFSCQYCGSGEELTFDHLLPRSKGGETHWDNVVTACSACNVKKGGKLLKSSGMKLNQYPYQPSTEDLHRNGKNFPPNYLHKSWMDYLYWDVELEA